MKRYLLDTNVLIQATHKDTADNQFLASLYLKQVYLSTINLAEALVKPTPEENLYLEQIFKYAQIIDISQAVARKAAKLRAQTLKSKKTILLDCLIAATAIEHNLILVTHNTKDFDFPNLTTYMPGT